MVAEAINSILLCNLDLLASGFPQAQVVKAKVGRKVRLQVAFEQGLCFRYICPFGESLAPPLVILGCRMKLRKVKGN